MLKNTWSYSYLYYHGDKMTELKSYKPYARLITIFSAILIAIAGLAATQVIQLFPEYANQINTVLVIAGILAPALAQEARVVRAEELVINDIDSPSEDDGSEDYV